MKKNQYSFLILYKLDQILLLKQLLPIKHHSFFEILYFYFNKDTFI